MLTSATGKIYAARLPTNLTTHLINFKVKDMEDRFCTSNGRTSIGGQLISQRAFALATAAPPSDGWAATEARSAGTRLVKQTLAAILQKSDCFTRGNSIERVGEQYESCLFPTRRPERLTPSRATGCRR